jgi:myosin heavy subunit
MESALKELEEKNSELRLALKEKEKEAYGKISELRDEYEVRIQSLSHKEKTLSSRISDLSLVNDTLQNEGATLREKVAHEKSENEKLKQMNRVLKNSMRDNDELETKRKKLVEEERSKFKEEINRMEEENEQYRMKMIKLESTVRKLSQRVEDRYEIDNRSISGDYDDIKTENEKLRRRIRILEHSESKRSQANDHLGVLVRTDDEANVNYYSLLKIEKEKRIKAEEFAAAMAARAKAGIEERNEEIMQLRMKVSSLEFRNDSIHVPLLTDGSMNPSDIILQERNDALKEAKRYEGIARKLSRHVSLYEGRQIVTKSPENSN